MSADPFSDVLRLTEAKSVMSGGFSAGGTWGLRIPTPGEIVFSAIAKGTCWLRLDGAAGERRGRPIRLAEGDVGLLSGDRSFEIASSATARAVEVAAEDLRGRIDAISADCDCTVLFGRVSLHPASAALLTDVLPPKIHIAAASPQAPALRWLIEQLLAEATSEVPGTSVASEKLAELLFVQILRAHVATAKSLPASWLRATTDERILRALRSVHAEPGRPWTLDELATAAAMSRTRFAVRFKAVAGIAPLAYVATWRMQLAQQRLRDDDASIAQLAGSLGYASESAFSNAFKRITGRAPRAYRTAARSAS